MPEQRANDRVRPLLDGRLCYGGDYNPEQWPREVWEEDVALMVEAGVNLVTVGVFSWAMLEPADGQFDFGWLRDVMDLLCSAGIAVDLATPTASPPPWVSVAYPDALPIDQGGARYWHGHRGHYCACSPQYRRLASRLVERMVTEVGGHESIALWHVNNEYGGPDCYCDHHAAAFRSWLARRYGSLDNFNAAWNTAFWSQRYGDFLEVFPPRQTPGPANPTQVLDYRRFSSDAYLAAMKAEKEILRKARPDIPVTTNFMGPFKPINYFAWARELDVVCTDNYPDPADPDYPLRSALHYDFVRSLNKSVPWLVMEQVTSRVNWRAHNVPKAPGAMRALSYQAIGRGATGILFFQWRASRGGAEKFHGAMVGHAGARTPSYKEVVELGTELKTLELEPSDVVAPAAICLSWDSWWAMEGTGMPASDLRLWDQVDWFYRPLFQAGVGTDFCHPGEDLSRYKVVMLPSLYLVEEAQAANITAFVEAGGTAIVSFWSGIVNANDQVYLGPFGGPLKPLIGADVVDVAPLAPDDELELHWSDGRGGTASFWCDLIEEGPAEVLARVASGPYAGRPAVLRARHGKGSSFYLGARLDAAGLHKVLSLAGLLADEPAGDFDGVERIARRNKHTGYEFFVNHGANEKRVNIDPGGTELLSGTSPSTPLRLPPQGVAIVRRPL